MRRRHNLAELKKAEAAENREHVRLFFMEHLCATQRECAKALGMSVMTVSRHVAAIRAEWQRTDKNENGTGKSHV